MSKILTGSNTSTIMKSRVDPAQERFVKQISTFACNRYKTLKEQGKLAGIGIFGDKILIQVTLERSIIALPDSAKMAGEIKRMTIYRLSKELKDRYPELEEGREVEINPKLLQFGNGHFLEWEDDDGAHLVYKVAFDHVECVI
jgi:hypothetical protein